MRTLFIFSSALTQPPQDANVFPAPVTGKITAAEVTVGDIYSHLLQLPFSLEEHSNKMLSY